jgi:RimJ/RimL family protein N-acetyltransferase
MTVRLEPLRVADAAEMTGVLSAPELYAVTGGSPPTVEQLSARYELQVGGRSADGREQWLNWVVRVDGAAVGYVQATVHDGVRAAVAWVIGAHWQGHGYATAAGRAMLGELRALGVRRVEAYIAPGHVASEVVAARLGLRPTGERDADGEQLWASADRPDGDQRAD